MAENLGQVIVTGFISAIFGALTSILVELFKEWRKKEKGLVTKQEKHSVKSIKKRSIIIGAFIGFIVGILISQFINHSLKTVELILWDFDSGIKDWTYFSDPQDASKSVAPGEDAELSTGVLVAKFNFAQVDLTALPTGMEPRATVWADNQSMDWTGFAKLLIDVKNVDSQLLEMTFSVYTDNCYYEFSGYQSLSQKSSWETIEFPFTQPKYKTCNSPDSKSSPANVAGIEQFYIIIGTNADHASLENEVHSILIDNIRLQK